MRRLLEALRAAADQPGLGVVLVEEHARQALQVADRACVLHRGQIVIDSPAADLLDDPEALERAYIHGTGA